MESLLRLAGLNWSVPDFSTLSRRQKTLAVNIPYRGSEGPLHLLIDSTGIKAEGEGEWNARKHDGTKHRVRHGRSDQWRDMAHGAKSTSVSTNRAIVRNEALRASKYLGRAIWRKWSGYHRRSRAEAKMNCVKLLVQSLMARDFARQVAELQVRAAVLNGYTALGIPVTKPIG